MTAPNIQLEDQLDSFVQGAATRLHAPDRKLLRDMLYGLVASRSLMLTNIARVLREPIPWQHTHRRLSRRLASKRFDDDFLSVDYLQMCAPFLRDDHYPAPLIVVDDSDIGKHYARAMPYLHRVRDGSQKPHMTNGYWMLYAEARGVQGRRLPLHAELYSGKDPEHISPHQRLERMILRAKPYVRPESYWVFDRGFAGNRNIEMFSRHGIRFIIRMKKDRIWYFRGKRYEGHQVLMGLRRRASRYRMKLPRKRRSKGPVRIYGDIAWLPAIRFQAHRKSGAPAGGSKDEYGMVVIWQPDVRDPIVLLTSKRIKDKADAIWVADNYLRRWSVEESFRFLKNRSHGFSLETDLRVLTWQGLKRLVFFAMLAYAFLSFVFHKDRAYIERIQDVFLSLDNKLPDFPYYALLRGFSLVFSGFFLKSA